MTPILALILWAPSTFDLRLQATPKPVVLNTVEDRVDGKEHIVLGTRFEIAVQPNLSATLTNGPFTSQGRTFGRPKTRSVDLTPQATLKGDGMARPPFMLSVPLPSRKVKAGDAWNATFVGPTPMPAGVKATYRALGASTVSGAPCVKIGMKVDTEAGGARITGGGEMAVRLSDGLVQTGSVNLLLVYHRPDQKTRQMTEFARVTVKARIARA